MVSHTSARLADLVQDEARVAGWAELRSAGNGAKISVEGSPEDRANRDDSPTFGEPLALNLPYLCAIQICGVGKLRRFGHVVTQKSLVSSTVMRCLHPRTVVTSVVLVRCARKPLKNTVRPPLTRHSKRRSDQVAIPRGGSTDALDKNDAAAVAENFTENGIV